MTKINKRGDKQISPKFIQPDLFDYLKKTAKEKNLSETTIINQALKLHKKYSDQ